jgi:hypothetical protein
MCSVLGCLYLFAWLFVSVREGFFDADKEQSGIEGHRSYAKMGV